jgi:hypothetical protein
LGFLFSLPSARKVVSALELVGTASEEKKPHKVHVAMKCMIKAL